MAATFLGCSQTPEAKYKRFLNSAKQRIEQRDYTRAALDLRNAIRLQPAEAEPHYQLGLACLNSKQYSQAIAELRKAVELNPKHAAAQVKIAELLVITREDKALKDAESRAETVLTAHPDSSDALFVLAASETLLHKPDEAQKHLETILARYPHDIRSAIALSKLKFSRKDIEGAVLVLKGAIERTPNSPEAPVALGALYASTARPLLAETMFRRAIGADPRNAPALRQLAELQLRAGKKEDAEKTYKQISLLPDHDAAVAYGAFLSQEGRRDAAIAEFARLAKLDPQNRSVRTRLVAAYVLSGRTAEAERTIDESLKKNPQDVEALLQRSEFRLHDGNFSEARNDLNKILQIEPASVQAHLLLAEMHRVQGSTLMQKQELGEALRLAPESLAVRTGLADAMTLTGDPKTALDLLDGAPQRQKQELAWIVADNWALIKADEQGKAQKLVDSALARGATPELILQDGYLKLISKNFAAARTAFEQVLKSRPEDVRALDWLGQSYAMQNQLATGVAKIEDHARRQPNSLGVQMVWANWLFRQGADDQVRQAIAAAKAANSKSADPDLLLARLDFKQGRTADAVSTLTRVVATNPNNTAARMMLGTIEDARKNYPEAMLHYRKVSEVDTSNVTAINNLAVDMCREGRDLDEALKYAQRAKELAPESSFVQDTLGWIYYRKGLYDMAARELKSALTKDARPAVKFHLGLSYLKSGNREMGRDLISKAVREDPNLSQTESWQ